MNRAKLGVPLIPALAQPILLQVWREDRLWSIEPL